MVATGNPYSDKCQVIDMTSSAKTCSNLPSYPLSMLRAAGGLVEGSPILCGGYKSSGSPKQIGSCYRFEKTTNSWKLHATLKSKRSHHSATVVKGALIVAGGIGPGVGDIASTEFIYSNGTVESGPDLPEAKHAHCMVTLQDGKVMILGGCGSSRR